MRSFAIAVLLFISRVVVAQFSQNMEFLGNKNDYAATGTYSACWGYVAPDGREYALLGCQTGTSIIDITDAPNLREVSFIPGPTSSWREMKTYRHYAYIVTENGNAAGSGIQIVDLSSLPTSASLVKTYVWTDTLNGVPTFFPRVHSVSVSGNYLYLNGGNYNGIRILDIRDPVNPVKAGVYVGPYIHDSHIRNDTIFASAINAGGGLDIIDARNKSNPQRLKLIQYAGSGTHNSWTTWDRNFLATTDEIGTTPKTLKIWDIRDLQNPAKVAEVEVDSAIVHNVFIKGTLAYVAWYRAGLRVVDLSNPRSPQIVGFYDTYPTNNGASYSGAWGADPYFPSGKVIISDMQTGLYVVRYTGDRRGSVRGTVRSANGSGPISNALLHFTDASITRWTDSNGQYLFGYAPGSYKVKIEAPGYQSREATVTISQGATQTFDFTLSPLTSVDEESSPREFALHQNFPNPFNPSTTIMFDSPTTARVELIVVDVLGREQARLVDGIVSGGRHRVQFTARGLPSGVYFSILRAHGRSFTRPMLLVK